MKSTLLLPLWGIWDWIYFRMNRMEFVSKDENIFRIVRKTYTGPLLQLQNGETLTKGDQMIKIHLYNYQLAKKSHSFESEIAFALYLKKEIECSLRGLSQYMQTIEAQDIKGVYGTSMLYRGAKKLGFEVFDVEPTLYNKYKSFLYKIIFILVHPSGISYLKKNKGKLHSKHIIMTTEELLKRYSS